MTLKVLMQPQPQAPGRASNGIARVIEAYAKYLPQFDVELVPDGAEHDIVAAHAGLLGAACDVSHCHGLYWSADYPASDWEYRTNAKVVESLRGAREITVPSAWVAETLQRDMHVSPAIVPHGIEWDAWQGGGPSLGYVLWNKNRAGDVCDPGPVTALAERNPSVQFISTFAEKPGPNVRVTGTLAHGKMRPLVQRAGVYLATTKETFGIGILEALASGVPVLGYAHGGIMDLVAHGETGYLAQPGNLEDLQNGLAYCLQYRDVLGARGREAARRWRWEAVAEQVATIYRRAAAPESPTVAIVIPSYNYGQLVSGAIKSALAQTYPQVTDVVVVDDGSSDKTAEVVAAWTKQDPRVRYIRQENQGVAVARNRGIAETAAKYICCLDADDQIEPEFVAALVPALEQDRTLGLAYSGLLMVSDQNENQGVWPGAFDYDAQVRGENQVPTCCLFRREAWKRAGGYRQRYAPLGCGTEDAEFWLRLGSLGYGALKATEKYLFRYRLGGLTTGKGTGYREVDWREWHPWVSDGMHPFASIATPERFSHPVRQYDRPLISVVIPVGPVHKDRVTEALDSLEAQTFRGWEAIVVDDRGVQPDNWLAGAYPFARYCSTYTDNGKNPTGAGHARNVGAALARGEFLLFLDADDWLLPDAMALLLGAFSRQEDDCVVYAASLGARAVDEDAARGYAKQGSLVSYKRGVATVRQSVGEYNYTLAVQQPFTERPYFWCYITSLLPTAWHAEVGGFDESLPAWEDWDYWIKLAKRGKPFSPVNEPIMVYSYDKGTRREEGRANRDGLMETLRKKHQEVEVMPCSSCGKRRSQMDVRRSSVQQAPPQQQADAAERMAEAMPDSDFVMVEYMPMHGGDHGVVGMAVFPQRIGSAAMRKTAGGFVFDYGHRSRGDTFLVHRADAQSAPQVFVPLKVAETQRMVRLPAITAPAPPAQPVAVQVSPVAQPELTPQPVRLAAVPFDPQTLPGVTPVIAGRMRTAGFTSLQAVIDHADDLTQISGIGDAKAKTIAARARELAAAEATSPASADAVLAEISRILGE